MQKPKAIMLDGFAANPGDMSYGGLSTLCDMTIYERTPKDSVVERIGDAEIIFTNKVVINERVMAQCPNLKYIGVMATGYNIIDLPAAAKRGICVTNVPAYSTESVAQLTCALMLECACRVGDHNAAVKRGEWQLAQDFTMYAARTFELYGLTLGIIGFGSIGSRVAQIGAALGMNVLGYSRNFERANETDKIHYAPLEKLLCESDVISLHCPATDATTNMINASTIAKMKDGAIVINTARGALVDEGAVADALNTGKLAFYAADVVSREPIVAHNPLLAAKNTILTPHIGWSTFEARTRLMAVLEDNLRAYLDGKPKNTVQ